MVNEYAELVLGVSNMALQQCRPEPVIQRGDQAQDIAFSYDY
jgi:hypothetical protein